MGPDPFLLLQSAFPGRSCRISRELPYWQADLGGGFSVTLAMPWRIVADGRVRFADADDGHWFGLPAPLDGEARANELLRGRSVERVEVDEETGDLRLIFDGATRLEALTQSAGYEGWTAFFEADGVRWSVIAMGGGELAATND